MESAVCYVRVSTLEQAQHGNSLEMQTERLNAYCTLNGLEVRKVITDAAISGKQPLSSRPGGTELLSILDGKQIRHVVSISLDRLFRNAEDALRQTSAWDSAGVTLHLVDMGGQSLCTSSAMGRMMLTMMAAFAEFERNLISERTQAALQHKKVHLQPYAQLLFGFDRKGDVLVVNEYELDIVRQIQEWRRNGLTLRAIANSLTKAKVPAKKDGQWYASTVRQILGNPIYGFVEVAEP